MDLAIRETRKRRNVQNKYNLDNNLKPESIVKEIKDITQRIKANLTTDTENSDFKDLTKEECSRLSRKLEKEMKTLASCMEFEKAALIRDQLIDLRTVSKINQN